MPAMLHPAAQRLNADVAGYTHTPEPSPGQPVAATAHEIAQALPTEYGGLHHLFSDSVVEPASIVDNSLIQPTQAPVGPNGGLAPTLSRWVRSIPVGPELHPPQPGYQPGGVMVTPPLGQNLFQNSLPPPAPGAAVHVWPQVQGWLRRWKIIGGG